MVATSRGLSGCPLHCSLMAWPADKVSVGMRRRVAVACQMLGCSPLLVLHDALEGVHEGDALAIMRAVHECARWGSPLHSTPAE